MALASLADLKAHVNIPTGDTTQDAELQGFLDAATAVVENICGPIVSRSSIVEAHSGNGARTTIVLRQRPVQSVQSVTEYVGGNTAQALTLAANPAAATTYSYTLDIETGTLTRRVGTGQSYPFTAGDDNIVVTYTAGFAAVPANVRLAALFQAAHLYQSSQLGGRPSWAGAGNQGDDGYSTSSGYAIPNRVRELLEPNNRIAGFA